MGEHIDILVLRDATRVLFYRGAKVVGSAVLVSGLTETGVLGRDMARALRATALRVAQKSHDFGQKVTVTVRTS